jgi:hypothetical protein
MPNDAAASVPFDLFLLRRSKKRILLPDLKGHSAKIHLHENF